MFGRRARASGAVIGMGACVPGPALAAGSVAGGSINYVAVSMFLVFVVVTLGITYWAAGRTRTSQDFYAAGRRVTERGHGSVKVG